MDTRINLLGKFEIYKHGIQTKLPSLRAEKRTLGIVAFVLEQLFVQRHEFVSLQRYEFPDRRNLRGDILAIAGDWIVCERGTLEFRPKNSDVGKLLEIDTLIFNELFYSSQANDWKHAKTQIVNWENAEALYRGPFAEGVDFRDLQFDTKLKDIQIDYRSKVQKFRRSILDYHIEELPETIADVKVFSQYLDKILRAADRMVGTDIDSGWLEVYPFKIQLELLARSNQISRAIQKYQNWQRVFDDENAPPKNEEDFYGLHALYLSIKQGLVDCDLVPDPLLRRFDIIGNSNHHWLVHGEMLKSQLNIINQVESLFQQGRSNLHLWGQPGVGKTTLVKALAKRWLKNNVGHRLIWLNIDQQSIHMPYHKYLVDQMIENAVKGALRIRELDALDDALEQKSITLVVLDGLVTAPMLIRLRELIPEDIRVLSTSNERFAVDNLDIVEITPLNSADARKLLQNIARKDFSSQDVDKLCNLLSYLPLAIKIAGENLRVRSKITIEQLFEDYQKYIFNMDRAGFPTESVERSVEIVWNTLDENSQLILLAICTVPTTRLTKSFLLEVSPVAGVDLQPIIDRLRDLSLITGYGDFYIIHDPIYQYIRQRHLSNEHIEYAINACINFVQNKTNAMEVLHQEIPNVLLFAREAGQQHMELELVDLMYTLSVTRGYRPHIDIYELYREMLEFAVGVSQANLHDGDNIYKCYRLIGKLANVFKDMGNYSKATETYHDAMKLADQYRHTFTDDDIQSKVWHLNYIIARIVAARTLVDADKKDFSTIQSRTKDEVIARIEEAEASAKIYHDVALNHPHVFMRPQNLLNFVYEQKIYMLIQIGDFYEALNTIEIALHLESQRSGEAKPSRRMLFALLNKGAALHALAEQEDISYKACLDVYKELEAVVSMADGSAEWFGHVTYALGDAYAQMRAIENAKKYLKAATIYYKSVSLVARAEKAENLLEKISEA